MKGFTLIELLIYVGLVSLVLFIVLNFSWQVVYGNIKVQSSREVLHNASFAMDKIIKEIKANDNPEIFYVSGNILYKDGVPLTTEQVKVTDFKITSLANSYLVELAVEYQNPGLRKEYESKINLRSSVSLFKKEPPPSGCWGTGGSCDDFCRYLSFGSLSDYYFDPGCSASCPSAGYFYINPSGSCSNDGAGVCYKMSSVSSSQHTVCSQDSGCDFQCAGTCTPCGNFLTEPDCRQQQGCRWFGRRCRGRCTACGSFNDQSSCQNQSGCSWNTIAWYWNLQNLQEGFLSYINCEWYVKN